jgi:hypothetical protein
MIHDAPILDHFPRMPRSIMPPKGWKKKDAAAAAPKKQTRSKKTDTAPVEKLLDVVAKDVGYAGKPETVVSHRETQETIHTVEVLLGVLASNRTLMSSAETHLELIGKTEGAIVRAVEHLDRLRASLPLGNLSEMVREEVKEATKAAPVAKQAPAPVPAAHTTPLQAPAPGVAAAPPMQAQVPFRPQ